MPSDGNGIYSLPPGYLAVTGNTIVISQHNPIFEDVRDGLTARLMRSGAAPMTGPLKLADGAVGAPALTLASQPTWGLYKTATGFGFSISGTLVAEFKPTVLELAGNLTVGKTATLKDGGDVASAGALTLGDGNIFNITGTTAITSIATKGIGTPVWLRFASTVVLTYHATNLITTGLGNITTAAGDWCMLEEYATGQWRMISYQRASGAAFGAVAAGECRLTKSGSNLLLSVYKGNRLTINGAPEVIPDAGITLAPPATSGTLYYIYAYMNAGVMTLEASATGYGPNANSGVFVKAADPTRTLVGMARTVSSAWVDTATQRFVRSFFNDSGVTLNNYFTANRSTTSVTYVELNSEIRVEFLTWDNDIVSYACNGAYSNATGGVATYTSVGFDSTTSPEDIVVFHTQPSGGTLSHSLSLASNKSGLSVGYHYLTVLGAVGSSTGTWNGSAVAANRTGLFARIR